MKRKISGKHIKKKSAKIINHKGFIAISMFSLGFILPVTMPALNPNEFFNTTNTTNYNTMPMLPQKPFFPSKMPFPSNMANGCQTETTATGTTVICNNYNHQEQNIVMTGEPQSNMQTINVPLPSLPPFCHYITTGTKRSVSCQPPFPSNIPITISPIPSIQVPLPSLPPNCKYEPNNIIHCTPMKLSPQPNKTMPIPSIFHKAPPSPYPSTTQPVEQSQNTTNIITSTPTKPNQTNNPFTAFFNFFHSFFGK